MPFFKSRGHASHKEATIPTSHPLNAGASPSEPDERITPLLSDVGDVHHRVKTNALEHSPIKSEGVPQIQSDPALESGLAVQSKAATEVDALNPRDPVVKRAIQAAIEHGEFSPLLEAGQRERPTVARRRAVAAAIRELTKTSENKVNRARVAAADGADFLVSLLQSPDVETVEHAVSAILNLSLTECVRGYVFFSPGSIRSIVNVLNTGNPTSKSNAAAALFSLADEPERKLAICHAGVLKPLISLLQAGTLRGKKDAALALFTLSLHGTCRKEMVKVGVVDVLVKLLGTPESGLEDKVVAIVNNLSKGREGREALVQSEAINLLLEIAENGSARAIEDAVSALFNLAQKSEMAVDKLLRSSAELTISPLSIKGTSRAIAKAKLLLKTLKTAKKTISSKTPEGYSFQRSFSQTFSRDSDEDPEDDDDRDDFL